MTDIINIYELTQQEEETLLLSKLYQGIQEGSLPLHLAPFLPIPDHTNKLIRSPWSYSDIISMLDNKETNTLTYKQTVEQHIKESPAQYAYILKKVSDHKKLITAGLLPDSLTTLIDIDNSNENNSNSDSHLQNKDNTNDEPRETTFDTFKEYKPVTLSNEQKQLVISEVLGKYLLPLSKQLGRVVRGYKDVRSYRSDLRSGLAEDFLNEGIHLMVDIDAAKEMCTTEKATKDGMIYSELNTGMLNHLDHRAKALREHAAILERGKINKEEAPQQVINIGTNLPGTKEDIRTMDISQLSKIKPTDL